MSKKGIRDILLGLAVGGVCFGLLVLCALGAKGKDTVMTSTETEPIYNHFPDLPKASKIEWCSRSTGGIGLVNHWLYIFAFYDHDIRGELQEMAMGDVCEGLELYYEPDEVRGQQWRSLGKEQHATYAFQDDIAVTDKLSTQVYINETGTILYVDAYWD